MSFAFTAKRKSAISTRLPFSVPNFWHYRDGQTVFSSIAADWGNGYILTGSGEPIQLLGGNVTANYFELLGVRPILGRNFLPEEEMKGRCRDRHGKFLAQTLQLRSDVIGRSITLNGVPHHHRGRYAEPADLWFGRDSEIFATSRSSRRATKERIMRGVSFMR